MKLVVRFLVVMLLNTFGYHLCAQSPDWIDAGQRKLKYPDNLYFTGYNEKQLNMEQDIQEAFAILKDHSLTILTESIQVTVESETMHQIKESGNNIEEYFKVSSTTSSNIRLSGVNYETWNDKKNRKLYALAWVKKNELSDFYLNDLILALDKLDLLIQRAKKQESSGQQADALHTYYECMPLLRQAEESLSLLLLMKGTSQHTIRVNELQQTVRNEISRIKKTSITDIASACAILADGLSQQTDPGKRPILLTNFTFQDTRMASPFSRKLSILLENALTGTGFKILTELTDQGKAPETDILKGTYWDEGENLKIIAVVKEPLSGETKASMDVVISKRWLDKNQLDYLPQNFGQAMADQMVFRTEELIGNDLLLECWTDKGKDSPIYTGGETMNLFFRINQPAYLRLIYYLADGEKTLLYDSYYIDGSKVNQVIQIPGEFVCSPPYGIETLQVLAQTEPFENLNVQNADGYDYIADDTKTIVTSTRGMMKKKPTSLKSEKRIVITTMEK